MEFGTGVNIWLGKGQKNGGKKGCKGMKSDWLRKRVLRGKYITQLSSYSLNLTQFPKQKMLKKYLLMKANLLMKSDIIKSKITCIRNLKGLGRKNSMNQSMESKSKQKQQQKNKVKTKGNKFYFFIILGRNSNLCSEYSILHMKFYSDTVF